MSCNPLHDMENAQHACEAIFCDGDVTAAIVADACCDVLHDDYSRLH